MGIVGARSGMCRSVCKCLLLKKTRHLSPTEPALNHHTPRNLKLEAGSWAARVIRGTHHAGGVTVWLRCPIRHTTDRPQPRPTPRLQQCLWGRVMQSRDLSIGACMAPMGPTYPSIWAGSSNSLKNADLWW